MRTAEVVAGGLALLLVAVGLHDVARGRPLIRRRGTRDVTPRGVRLQGAASVLILLPLAVSMFTNLGRAWARERFLASVAMIGLAVLCMVLAAMEAARAEGQRGRTEPG